MKKLGFIVLLVFTLTSINQIRASHLMGSDLTWRCIGQDSFLVKLVVYRNCNGITLGTSPINFNCATSNSFITSLNIGVGTPVDITPVCNSSCTRCLSTACSFPYGIHKYTMQGIVKLTGAGSCCSIRISWAQSARNSAITTSTGAGTSDLYIEASLNRCQNPCDNSPYFTNVPIAILCVGQDLTFNNGVSDNDVNADGSLTDSLTYEWTEPLGGLNAPIPYLGLYAYNKAINFLGFPNDTLALPAGIHLNKHTGDIQFRPMKSEVTIMVIKVNEFRNGVKIAEIRRDLQVMVISCANNKPPTLTTFNNITSKTVCAGQPVSFNFTTFDSNSTDTAIISWSNTIPGAIWTHTNGTSKHPTATLSWTPTTTQGGSKPYGFIVTVKDNACPIKSQVSQYYEIIVNPAPKIAPIDKVCVNGSIISLNDYVTVGGTFKAGGFWSSPSAGLLYGDKFNPKTAGVSSPPGWKVKYYYTDPVSSCFYTDSTYITIYDIPKPYAGLDDTICSGSKKMLTGYPLIPPGFWSGIGIEGSSSNWQFNPDTIGILDGGTYDLIYHYTDNSQCSNDDTMKVTVYKAPVADAGLPKEFCINAISVILIGSPIGGIWSGKGVAGNMFSPSTAGVGVHNLSYYYVNVICIAVDKVKYTVWDLPLVTANTVSGKTYFCRNDGLVQLNGQPTGTGGLWSGPGVSGITFNPAIGADVKTDYGLLYNYTDNHKCTNKADLLLSVKPEPEVVIDPSASRLCFGTPYSATATYRNADGISWWKGAQSDGSIVGNSSSNMISYNPGVNDLANLYFWINVKTTHSDNICAPTYDSIKVRMGTKPNTPVISLTPSDSFLECNIPKGSYQWYIRPNMASAPINVSHSRRINPQLSCNICYFSAIYFDSIGCASDTSAPYHYIGNSIPQNNPKPHFLIYPNPSHNILTVENPENQGVNIIISDIFGKNLIYQILSTGKNTINISSLKPGIYFMRLKDQYVYRLLVE